jgi:Fur family iron response transcriptional regulator
MVWTDAPCKARQADKNRVFCLMAIGKSRKQTLGPKASPEQIAKLRAAGLRPTRQRLGLAALLFGPQDRHVSAEKLHEEASAAGIRVSLATVYNTLHQFTESGLLRELSVDGARTYFDTNLDEHYHFYCEEDGELIDIESHSITVDGLPQPPEGAKLTQVDVIVRLSRR